MNTVAKKLREACTGGRECQCSYRVGADEIDRLEYALHRAKERIEELGNKQEQAAREAQAAKLKATEMEMLFLGLRDGSTNLPGVYNGANEAVS